MPEFAPGFDDNSNRSVLPKNTSGLINKSVRNALNGTTIGAAAGTVTTVNKTQVKGRTSQNADTFGTTAVENFQPINRASTAADVTEMKRVLTKKKPSFAMPRDLSGNGGPAFTRT